MYIKTDRQTRNMFPQVMLLYPQYMYWVIAGAYLKIETWYGPRHLGQWVIWEGQNSYLG